MVKGYTGSNDCLSSYDLYWGPPGKSYWVRLLKERPAVVIHAGAKVVQPDINADMRVIGQ